MANQFPTQGGTKIEELLTVVDVARILSCSEMHARNLIARGKILATRPGELVRVRPDDLRAYLDRVSDSATREAVPA